MGNLKVGTSKICISPTPEMFPFPAPAYQGENIKIEGIYFDMYVRMIAVSNGKKTFLFGVFEESNGSDALKDAITEKYGIPYENQMYSQIHNHGGVTTTTVVKEGRGQKPHHSYTEIQIKMGRSIYEKALEAADIALKDMRPACWGFGEGKSYINVNRDLPNDDGYWTQGMNFDGISDKTLAVLKFVDEQGNLIAAILNYCAHPITTIGAVDIDGKRKVSADFPGFTCSYLENKYKGAVVCWTTGAGGDQNAIYCYSGRSHYTETCESGYGDIPPGFQYHYSQYLGERHAADADKVLKRIDCHRGSLDMRSACIDVYIPQQMPPAGFKNFWLQIAMAQNNVENVAERAPELVKDGKIINRQLIDYEPNGKFEDCEVQLFILGDLAIITVAAELYVKLGILLKEASPLRNSFVITVAGGHGNRVGYIQDTESNTHKTFQHYGEAYPCDSNKIFSEGMSALIDKVFECG
jgi:hypothetical protein